jgi:hypothetical protein
MQNQVNSPTFGFFKKVFDSIILIIFGILVIVGSTSDEFDEDPEFSKSMVVFFVLYFIVFAITLCAKKDIYQNTTFELSENSVKYRRDFFGVEQKSVRYVDIKEVVLKQSFAQKWYDIGSVEVKVFAATSNPEASTGIELFDLKNYKEVYDFLLEKTKHNPVK